MEPAAANTVSRQRFSPFARSSDRHLRLRECGGPVGVKPCGWWSARSLEEARMTKPIVRLSTPAILLAALLVSPATPILAAGGGGGGGGGGDVNGEDIMRPKPPASKPPSDVRSSHRGKKSPPKQSLLTIPPSRRAIATPMRRSMTA